MKLARIVTLVAPFALLMAFSQTASAVKYMSIGQAVKTYIPKGAKIFKVTKKLSTAQKNELQKNYGWEPKQDKYVFYVGKQDGKPVSYVFVVPEIFNTCFHKYAIGMKPNGEIIETVIIELSCPRAFPINKKSFLGQFKEKRHQDALTVHSDIDAVTGATLSSAAAATAARKAVSLHNLYFGGNEKVMVASNVKEARKKAAGMIQKAIETGETLEKEGKGGAAQLPPEASK